MVKLTLHITALRFTGHIVVTYNEADQLNSIDASQALLTQQQVRYVFNNIPIVLTKTYKEDFLDFIGNSTMTIASVAEPITFKMFWNHYGKKVNNDRCIPLFNKLSDNDKYICYNSIADYLNYLERVTWRSKADPETYLRKKMYNNHWRTLND